MNTGIGGRTVRFWVWLLPHLAALDPMGAACAAVPFEEIDSSRLAEPAGGQDHDRPGVVIQASFRPAEANR